MRLCVAAVGKRMAWGWFLPKDPDLRQLFEAELEQIVVDEGQTVLGWRTVPTDSSSLGETAIAGEPFIRQLFVGRNDARTDRQ